MVRGIKKVGQLFVLTMAVMYVVLNLLIDVLYGVIDPRVRLEG